VGKSLFFGENGSDEDKKMGKIFIKSNMAAMSKALESVGLAKYTEIIQGKIDSFYETLQNIFKDSGELRVLNHGDCWTTNVLYKYNDSNEIIDVKIVDYQMIQVGSYAQDLIYFWWSSARKDVRENLQEEMFEVYRKTLNETLDSVQVSERVSKEEFDKEMRRFSPFALSVCSSILTVAMADPDDLLNFNEMTLEEIEGPVGEDSKMTKNYRSKYYKEILPDLFRQLEKFGALS
jgi:hypothetical protein